MQQPGTVVSIGLSDKMSAANPSRYGFFNSVMDRQWTQRHLISNDRSAFGK
ncbi:hypothetical protein HDF12_003131 [Edaphobacter lichenicola]|uniref:Uncharacterized protein n=1 Tax=Tunturiibacter lichenicola TaxID=2051959 RepID=A0A7Y9NP07_9BACT|nr:hypothetical protein [Edaphobacter lichenicola]